MIRWDISRVLSVKGSSEKQQWGTIPRVDMGAILSCSTMGNYPACCSRGVWSTKKNKKWFFFHTKNGTRYIFVKYLKFRKYVKELLLQHSKYRNAYVKHLRTWHDSWHVIRDDVTEIGFCPKKNLLVMMSRKIIFPRNKNFIRYQNTLKSVVKKRNNIIWEIVTDKAVRGGRNLIFAIQKRS